MEHPAQFDDLQRKLVSLWTAIGRADPGGSLQEANTIVVLPSLTVDMDLPFPAQQAYEERFLFMLLLLQQPHIRLIYLSSHPIAPGIIDYYLHLVPGVTSSHARKRLFLVSPLDASARPLTHKVVARPRLIQQIRALIPDLDRAHLVPFITTDVERELALRLGIPMYAADPRFFAFGTKSGSRRLFAEEGVQHPLGVENLGSAMDIARAIAWMRARRPPLQRVIIKLNAGVSGMGNAIVDLDGLPLPGDPAEDEAIAARLPMMQFELAGLRYIDYFARVQEHGAVVEELIVADQLLSPSVQLRVTPLGDVELLSTHDQMLGGPHGQSYLGARFPANPAYGPLIMREAAKIGRRLAREGIVGRFALDFVVFRTASGVWQPYAIEINLRKGGTTHPFLTLQYLTDGQYDVETGVFRTGRGQPKYYVASDHVEAPAYEMLTPDNLLDIVSRHRLHFNHTSQTGVVLHMMSGVATLGRLGVTAIGDSPEAADTLYNTFVGILDAEAHSALALDDGDVAQYIRTE